MVENKKWHVKEKQLMKDNSNYYFQYNVKEWLLFGQTHGIGDNPAVIKLDKTKMWLKCGEFYRRDASLPHVLFPDGTGEWWKNGCKYEIEISFDYTAFDAQDEDI